jgi:hypothetical protein
VGAVSAVLVIGGSERAERLGPREEWGSPGWARESGGAAARDSGSGWDLAICFDEHKFRFCHYWHIFTIGFELESVIKLLISLQIMV